MIKVIAFDYGGVIIVSESDLFEKIADYLHIDKKDFSREYHSANHLFNVENESFEEVVTAIALKFNNSEETRNDILNLIKDNTASWHLNTPLIDVIKDLKNRNYKIALLSNNSIELRQQLKKDGIIDLFDEIIVSAEVGYQKPQPEIFNILFEKLEVNPNEVVFIDDSLKSLEGADEIGYIPILYKDDHTLKAELSNVLNKTFTEIQK